MLTPTYIELSPVERLAFAEAVAADGMIEADESDFLLARLPGCMEELAGALQKLIPGSVKVV